MNRVMFLVRVSKYYLSCLLCLVLLHSAIITAAQAKTPFPKGTKRILFLGNSITYAGQYITDLEAYFVTHYPDQRYEFINVGLPSETVSGLSEPNHADGKFPRPDLHERLARVLEQVKPDVVFANYGMNDGIYLPFDEARFKAFRSGMLWLHAQLENAGAKRIIHVTPPVHDDKELGTKGYNLVLDKYAAWLLSQKDSLKWEVADVHTPMTEYLNAQKAANPAFKLANDGVHPGDLGHWLMAKAMLQYLGEPIADAPDVFTTLQVNPHHAVIYNLVKQRQSFMKDAWLSSTGHKRPGMKPGMSLTEARQKYAQIEKQLRATLKGKAPTGIIIPTDK